MTDRDQIISEDELHAYVDGELPADRRGAVEAWLATHADDAAHVAAWRAQAEIIRKRYGGVANEVPPKRLGAAAEAPCAIQPTTPPARNAMITATAAIARQERPLRASLSTSKRAATGSNAIAP